MNFFHCKYFKNEICHFGLNKVRSTTQSNILQFFLWMQIKTRYLYYGLVQTNSDLFGSATKQKIYSNALNSQNLIDISEKHKYIISRSLSVQEFTL